MDFNEYLLLFLVTLAATFIATLPAVYIGLTWERRARLRDEAVEASEAVLTKFRLVTEPGGVFFDCRDWLNLVVTTIDGNNTMLLTNRHPSIEGLRVLLYTHSIPGNLVSATAQLLSETIIVESLVAPYMGTVMEDPVAKKLVHDRANFGAKLAMDLIESSRRDPGVETALGKATPGKTNKLPAERTRKRGRSS